MKSVLLILVSSRFNLVIVALSKFDELPAPELIGWFRMAVRTIIENINEQAIITMKMTRLYRLTVRMTSLIGSALMVAVITLSSIDLQN